MPTETVTPRATRVIFSKLLGTPGLVAAFAADVPLYLFDEPTDGLDPLMAQVYRECVTEVRDAGRQVQNIAWLKQKLFFGNKGL